MNKYKLYATTCLEPIEEHYILNDDFYDTLGPIMVESESLTEAQMAFVKSSEFSNWWDRIIASSCKVIKVE